MNAQYNNKGLFEGVQDKVFNAPHFLDRVPYFFAPPPPPPPLLIDTGPAARFRCDPAPLGNRWANGVHSGGEEVLLDVGGQDATEAFEDVGHSDEAREILEGLLVGKLERKVRFAPPYTLPPRSAGAPFLERFPLEGSGTTRRYTLPRRGGGDLAVSEAFRGSDLARMIGSWNSVLTRRAGG